MAQRLGAEGEEAVGEVLGLAKNVTERFGSRIPDFVGKGGSFIAEVKNVGYQAYTRQLREMFDAANAAGAEIQLWVREGTKLSGPLQDAVRRFGAEVSTIPAKKPGG